MVSELDDQPCFKNCSFSEHLQSDGTHSLDEIVNEACDGK